MKYVKNLELFLERLIDSDKIEIDFHDTFIGATLNRALGLGRTKVLTNRIEKIAQQLEALLASLVVSDSFESVEEVPDVDSEEIEKLKDVLKIKKGKSPLGLPEAEEKIEEFLTGKELMTIANKLSKIEDLGSAEKKDEISKLRQRIENLPKNQQDKFKREIRDISDIMDEIYGTTDIKLGDFFEIDNQEYLYWKYENGKAILMDISSGENISLSDNELKELSLSKQLDKNQLSLLKRASGIYKLITDDIDKLEKSLSKEQVKKLTKHSEYAQNIFISIANKIKRNELAGLDGEINELNTLREKIYKMVGDTGVSTLEKKSNSDITIDSIRQELEKKIKNTNISEKALEEIEKIAKERKGRQEISGEDLRKITQIAYKAKDAIMHQKPFEDIRKKQQRYFDKIEDGRAISRKGYQIWANRINQILSYYKDILPKPILTYVAGLSDKSNISDDFNKLSREFLDIKTTSVEKSLTDDKKKIRKQKTTDDKKQAKFIGINRLESIKEGNVFAFKIKFTPDDKEKTSTTLNIVASVEKVKNRKVLMRFSTSNSIRFIKGKTNLDISLKGNRSDEKNFNTEYNEVLFNDIKRIDVRLIRFSLDDLLRKSGTAKYINLTNIRTSPESIDFNKIEENSLSGSFEIKKMALLVDDDLNDVVIGINSKNIIEQDVVLDNITLQKLKKYFNIID